MSNAHTQSCYTFTVRTIQCVYAAKNKTKKNIQVWEVCGLNRTMTKTIYRDIYTKSKRRSCSVVNKYIKWGKKYNISS